MSKFLRMVESNLPTEGQSEHKIEALDVLMNIHNSLQELNSKFTIGTSQSENSPPEGDDSIRSAIMNINGIPKFKITVTPISVEEGKSEEGEDDIISAAAGITKKDPAKASIGIKVGQTAAELAGVAATNFKRVADLLKSQKKI